MSRARPKPPEAQPASPTSSEDLKALATQLAERLEQMGAAALAARVKSKFIGVFRAREEAPEAQVNTWLGLARLLKDWEVIRDDLDRPTDLRPGWPFEASLIARCKATHDRINERPGGWLNCLSLAAAADQALLREAADLLEECRGLLNGLTEGSRELREVPGRAPDVIALRDRLGAAIQKAAPDVATLIARWDSTVLQRLEARAVWNLVSAVDETRTYFGGQQGLHGRIALSLLMAEVIGEAEQPGSEELKQLESFAGKLFEGTKVIGEVLEQNRFQVRLRDARSGRSRPLGHAGQAERSPAAVAAEQVHSWLVRSRGDRSLARLCSQWQEMVGSSPAEWWAVAKPPERAVLWRLVQRLHLLSAEEPAVTDFFASLREAGFSLTAPGARAQGMAEGAWLMGHSPESPTGIGPVLRGPDGETIEPAVWLRPAQPSRAAVRCWHQAEPLLAQLKIKAPGWEGWGELNIETWSAANGEADVPTLRAALDVCCDSQKRSAKDKDAHRLLDKLASHFARCLKKDFGATLFPDPDGPPLIEAEALPANKVRCVPSEKPVRSIVRVRRYGVNGSAAEIDVSFGAELPAWLDTWVRLPILPEGPNRSFFSQWQQSSLMAYLASPERMSRQDFEQRGKHAWQRRLVTDEGMVSFGQLVVQAQTGNKAAKAWLEAMKADGWFASMPQVVDGQPVWPDRLTAALPIRTAANKLKTDSGKLKEAAEKLVQAVARATLLVPLPIPDVVALVRPLLARLHEAPADLAAAVSQWCALHGLTLLPESAAIPSPRPGLTIQRELSDEVEAGRVLRVEAYGLTRQEEVIEPGRVVVSAGPPPEAYWPLEKAIEEAGWLELLGELREAVAGAGLTEAERQQAVRQSFPRLWDAVLAGPEQKNVQELLLQFVETWAKVDRDWPECGKEPPGNWETESEPGSRARVVKDTLRPGLRDRTGKMVAYPKVLIG